MPASGKLVKLERGRFSSKFQVARACISAASALMSDDPSKARVYLASAIDELLRIKQDISLDLGRVR
jgi:hypothetical protein